MPWTFSWPSKPKKPWIQYILKVGICPLISRWRFEGLSLCDVRFLFSQRIFFLSLQQFSLLFQQHTQAFCFPALNIPPSRIIVRLHLIGPQKQLENWKKMHKLLITWAGWWNPDRRPHQPALDKKARILALLMPCEGMWIGTMPGSQLQFTLGCTLVSGADSHHWNRLPRGATRQGGCCTSLSLLQGWNIQCEKSYTDILGTNELDWPGADCWTQEHPTYSLHNAKKVFYFLLL